MTQSPVHILLIEDNLSVSYALEKMFCRGEDITGHLHYAASLEEALKIICKEPIDVVLLDVRLPDSVGYNSILKIKELRAYLPIIILTSFDDPALAETAIQQGAEDYLVKESFDSQTLFRAVRYAIEKRKMREKLNEVEVQYKTLASNVPGAICRFQLDSDRTLLAANEKIEAITGFPRGHFIHSRIRSYSSIIFTEDAVRVANSIEKFAQEGGAMCLVYRVQHKDGSIRWIREQGRVVKSPTQGVRWLDVTLFDITASTRTQQQLNYLSQYDSVTRLPNRVLFYDRLKQAVTHGKREQAFVGLLCVGLDLFERVNETLGHAIGDQLLQQISERLQESLYESDTLTRISGDEFMILLPKLHQMEDMGVVVQKVFGVFKKPFLISGHEIYMTCSVGISYYPAYCQNAEELLKQANIAMHYAKRHGRNRYRLYSPTMSRQAKERFDLQNDLRHALENQEFELFYQPMVDAENGVILAAEALLRWNHPKLGLISPDFFIPLAEESGFIVAIGKWVLEAACAQGKMWQEQGYPPIRIAVNVSMQQFESLRLMRHVHRALQKSQLEPKLLEIELTEGLMMHNVEETLSLLQNLRGLGIKVSIDDFGTGHSSLGQLKRFPIDTLKIDRIFIRDLVSNSDDAAIAKAIISMAHHLRLNVVAEGVETLEQLAFLRSHQCHLIQGFLFSKPVPGSSFAELFKKIERKASSSGISVA